MFQTPVAHPRMRYSVADSARGGAQPEEAGLSQRGRGSSVSAVCAARAPVAGRGGGATSRAVSGKESIVQGTAWCGHGLHTIFPAAGGPAVRERHRRAARGALPQEQ